MSWTNTQELKLKMKLQQIETIISANKELQLRVGSMKKFNKNPLYKISKLNMIQLLEQFSKASVLALNQ